MARQRLVLSVTAALLAIVVAFLLLARRGHDDAVHGSDAVAPRPPAAKPAPTALAAGGATTSKGREAAASSAASPTTGAGSTPLAPGWRLRLLVESSVTHRPLAGATVRVVLQTQQRQDRTLLGAFVADADGRIDVPLPALDAMSPGSRAAHELRSDGAWAPGHRLASIDYPLSAEEEMRGPPKTLESTVELEPGPVARGRVLDADGRPVARARVALHAEGEEVPTSAESDEDGRFVTLPPGVGKGWVRVEGASAGTAVVAVTFGARDDAEIPDLVLRGPGVIAGIVVTPDGTPVAGIPVVAAPLKEPKDAREEHDAPAGLDHAEAMTDAEGRFRITGLREGRLHVRAAAEPFGPTKGVEVATGDLAVRLVLEGHVFRVRVVDEAGAEIVGATIGLWVNSEQSMKRPVLGETGEFYLVKPGSEFELSANVPGLPSTRQTVTAGPLGGPAVVTLTIRVPKAAARLRPRLDGDEAAAAAVQLVIAPADGSRVVDAPSSWTSGDPAIEVPPGAYHVRALVRERSAAPGDDSTFLEQSWTGWANEGKETIVPIRVERGGLLRVVAEIPDSITSPTLESGDAAAVATGDPLFVTWTQATADGGTVFGDHIPLRRGVPFQSAEAIRAGSFRFTFTVSGCKPAAALAVIEAGKTTATTIRLEPK